MNQFMSRVRLAVAVLLGAEIVHHMDAFDKNAMTMVDDEEWRSGLGVPAFGDAAASPAVPVSQNWLVTKEFTVWIPRDLGGRVSIVPVKIPARKKLTVVRW